MVGQEYVDGFQRDGYVIVRELFSREEVAAYRDHFMRLRAAGTYPGDFAGVDLSDADPWKRYPRLIHMHRWDELSLQWLLDDRLRATLHAFLGGDPFAVQTMLYFKPPGARGQALHQDQYFLQVQPGTCVAAWLALDASDEENGCMQIVPGSQDLPELCTVRANTEESFTDITVPLPEGMAPLAMVMRPGDVLFFNGSLIHGSFPNRSADRFRRSLIGHYIVGNAEQVAAFYHPVLRMDGILVDLERSLRGGSCGVWVERDGDPVVEMAPRGAVQGPLHE